MPQHFARSVARLGGMVATRCGNQHLARLLRDQLDHTLWGFIWRDRPLDFFTPRRQMAARPASAAPISFPLSLVATGSRTGRAA